MRRNQFQALYERYAGEVYRFALWLTRDSDDAEELAAEAFARAWVVRGKIRVETVKAYLLAITRNLHRKAQRRRGLPTPSSDGLLADSGQTRVLLREELRLVWEEIHQLKEEDRAAFLLRVFSELPYDEVARILGISVSSAKVKVHRVRLRLALAADRRGQR